MSSGSLPARSLHQVRGQGIDLAPLAGGGLGHFIGPQDLDAGQQLDGSSRQVFPEPAQFVQVEDRGGDEKLGARGQLLFELDELGR